jgi:hypothetical protein
VSEPPFPAGPEDLAEGGWSDGDDGDDGDDVYALRRPPWWRWVAIVLIVSLVVATPFAYALYRWLR